ncbi:TRAP transporter small permease subunit [Sneathiella chungangensis]|uniref:TRAP transporter small permease protein n=1 Tax=Sneathiella chungangensis TaxID=1418234 RepID=A0A845MGP5_9PROT|nr:TRAP transporter small permease [Sneathiella chungangensis]MZR23193.1 TRAP transporter small permease subunit [Sneathiella chungangensis]
MGQLNNFLSNIERLLMIGAAICLVAIMIVMVSDVVMRYLFSSPISWAFEVLTRYLMLGSFFFAVSHTLEKNEHLYVEIFHRMMPDRLGQLLLGLAYACTAVVLAGASWMSYLVVQENLRNSEYTAGGISWPLWTSTIIISIGLTLLTARMLLVSIMRLYVASGADTKNKISDQLGDAQ